MPKVQMYKDILPFLYYGNVGVQKFEPPTLPNDVLSEAKRRYLANTGRNILFMSELTKIIKAFNRNGIQTLLLKGAGLLITVYQNIGVREINDLDILIRPEDLKKSEEILSKLGYSFLGTNEGSHNIYCNNIVVELHWDIINNVSPVQKYAFKLKVHKIWETAIPATVNGEHTLVMCPEDNIIYLSCHMLKEFYSSGKWCTDIFAILHKNQIDWDKLIKRATEFGVAKTVYYGLKYVDELFNATIPENVFRQLMSNPRYSDEIIFSLPLRNISVEKWRLFLYLSVIEKFTDKLRALRDLFIYIPKKFNIAPGFR